MNTTPHATEHLLQLQQVSFAYPGASGQRLILDSLNLNVPRGKVTALMGASGGGKTTVLRLIGGQQRADPICTANATAGAITKFRLRRSQHGWVGRQIHQRQRHGLGRNE